MEKFSEFNQEVALDGDKIPLSDVLNQEIIILNYRKSKSKKRENTEYITIQIEHDGKRRVIFTGSEVLKNQLEKYKDHLPFQTIIKKINTFYSFT